MLDLINIASLSLVLYSLLAFLVTRTTSNARKIHRLFILSTLFVCLASPVSFLLLAITAPIDFFLARRMETAQDAMRRQLLYLGITISISTWIVGRLIPGILLESGINLANLKILTHLFSSPNDLLGALGISYFTFKKIAYISDVYRINIAAEKSFRYYALYLFFFPTFSSGPIDRPALFLTQAENPPQQASTHDTQAGLQRILWGLLKKHAASDGLALMTNPVFHHPDQFSNPIIFLSTVAYTLQIYLDFSGYTDIALGISRCMGFRLTENFKTPYLAKSIGDFWNRWHISLSSWLKDYLFLTTAYPLSRFLSSKRLTSKFSDQLSYLVAMTITMALCGVWHGFKWNFIAWGSIHGFYMSLAFLTKKIRNRIRKACRIQKNSFIHHHASRLFLLIFIHFSWILFRTPTLSSFFILFKKTLYGLIGLPHYLFSFFSNKAAFSTTLFSKPFSAMNIHIISFWLVSFAIIALEHKSEGCSNISDHLQQRSIIYRFSWLMAALIIWATLPISTGHGSFIYRMF